MKQNRLLPLMILAASFAACNQQDKSNQAEKPVVPKAFNTMDDCINALSPLDKSANTVTMLENLFRPKQNPDIPENKLDPKDAGRPIPFSLAKPCMDRYINEMRMNGLDSTGGRSLELLIMSRKITTAELFGSENLLRWMQTTVNLFDKAENGANLGFELRMGILDASFLKAAFPDPADSSYRTAKLNRIVVFIVPFHTKNGKQMFQDFCVYELGGLQP
jgi:hypothetical protein